MKFDLSGQVVVVSGGSSGIGWAIAREFRQEGARVYVLDRQTIAEPGEFSDVTALLTDVTDFSAVQQRADELATEAGRVDHVVCAAGVGSGHFGFPFWNVPIEAWDRVWQVNVMGTVHLAQAFQPMLRERGDGTLLTVASVAGQIGSQTDPPYSAAKAAVINFTQCAAKDLAPFGVRANCLCPGMVRTPLNRSVYESWASRQPAGSTETYEEWTDRKIRQVVPLQRWQEPEDVAALAVFLASSRGRNITGQTLNVDGGFVMHW